MAAAQLSLHPIDTGTLSRSQRAAVEHDAGPAAVHAGPGSGKTRVVTLRADRLVRAGARPLVTTFTNDATLEMRRRLGDSSAAVTTMHALCHRILREELGAYRLITDESSTRAFALAAKADQLEMSIAEFLRTLSFQKNLGMTAARYKHDGSGEDRDFAAAWREFEKRKAAAGLLEFDDLCIRALDLFDADDTVRARWAGRHSHIIVDECQDINTPQYRLIFSLGRDSRNVMLVGDPDQSLYAFRGADTVTFQRFAGHAETAVYELADNYRCTGAILAFADGIIRQDQERRPIALRAVRDMGDPVRWDRMDDPDEEAAMVVREIAAQRERGLRFGDMAVLYRTNAQSEAFERQLAEAEIPYVAREQGDFYLRREVQGMLAYLQFFATQAGSEPCYSDEALITLLNTPDRKISRDTAHEMRNAAEVKNRRIWDVLPQFFAPDLAQHRAVRRLQQDLQSVEQRLAAARTAGDAIAAVRAVTGFDAWLQKPGGKEPESDRLQNIARMQSAAARYPTIGHYLHAVQQVRDNAARSRAERARKRRTEDAVTLGTCHSAKGLEWRCVFAVGWSQGLLPHKKSDSIAEERRIAYVTATRARETLIVSTLDSWNDAPMEPSQFLTAAGSTWPAVPTPAEPEEIFDD